MVYYVVLRVPLACLACVKLAWLRGLYCTEASIRLKNARVVPFYAPPRLKLRPRDYLRPKEGIVPATDQATQVDVRFARVKVRDGSLEESSKAGLGDDREYGYPVERGLSAGGKNDGTYPP
jgi:hypothetical protein